MAQIMFYRYISHPGEVKQICNERKIKSMNPKAQGTWFTTTRYEDPDEAQDKLALFTKPTHRIGPIPANGMPDFDIPLRPVAPANSQPGGGVEALTKDEVWVLGLYEFDGKIYIPLHN